MSVTIKRKTGWFGMGVKIAIKLNNEKVAKIGYDQEIELDIPSKGAQLKVSQQGVKSNELEVKDGDIVEITTLKWGYLIVFLPSILVLLPIFSVNTFLRFFVITLLFSSLLFINAFKLNISEEKFSDLSS